MPWKGIDMIRKLYTFALLCCLFFTYLPPIYAQEEGIQTDPITTETYESSSSLVSGRLLDYGTGTYIYAYGMKAVTIEYNGETNLAILMEMYLNGERVFCIEPEVVTEEGVMYQPGVANGYLSREEERILGLISYFGYGYQNDYSEEMSAATMVAVWEARGRHVSDLADCVRDKVTLINKRVAMVDTHPSFEHQELFLNGYGPEHAIQLQDEHHVLQEYQLFDSGGYQIEQNGNTLTIWNNHDQKAIGNIILDRIPRATNGNSIVYTNADNKQKLMKIYTQHAESMQLSLTMAQGNLLIQKVDEDGNSIPNTTFALSYDEDMSSNIGIFHTGEDGTVEIPLLEPVPVYVQEIAVPDPYVLDDSITMVQIIGNETAYFTKENKYKKGYVEILKKDKDTLDMVAEEGVQFDIYNDYDEFICSIFTDASGIAKSDALRYGSYYAIEVSAPALYYINEERQYFKIQEDETIVSIDVLDEKIPIIQTGITIHKNPSAMIFLFAFLVFITSTYSKKRNGHNNRNNDFKRIEYEQLHKNNDRESHMQIEKRNHTLETYHRNKIEHAVEAAFLSVKSSIDEETLKKIMDLIEVDIFALEHTIHVEMIQDIVETNLMKLGYHKEVKSYVLYREERAKQREARNQILSYFHDLDMKSVLKRIQTLYPEPEYSLVFLYHKMFSFQKSEMNEIDQLRALIFAAVELTTQEASKWEYIAAMIKMEEFQLQLKKEEISRGIHTFYDKLCYLTEEGLYGDYILKHYSKEEVQAIANMLDYTKNNLLTYSSLDLLIKRYVIATKDHVPLESPQEMFMGIAMHLAMNEQDRLYWVKKFYDMLSNWQVTMATPTMSNARKPYHQLSSCFIDTVSDSLDGIYRSISNFAMVSKFGGGMGLYFGKVRAQGASIRGFEGAAGGVIRWIKLVNDTAVAVDQLGVRQGAVAVYLDAWHKDLPEFLQLRTNNGDDRMKAHDVFPAVCFPDYFWKSVKENLDGMWYMMCPHEIKVIKGYALEDSFGDEWEEKYLDCIHDYRISKREIPLKDLVRLILKSAIETGTPFTFNRDSVNRMNPNQHAGKIYCSNLCTEIAQNMSEIEFHSETIQTEEHDTIIVEKTKAGDFVVCNLASLVLGNMQVENDEHVQDVVATAIRALDNVIDLNFYPLPYAKITNQKYRSIGLGISGYHHCLANQGIAWESEEHLTFCDTLFERINFHAIAASNALAKERGAYAKFKGSDWDNGAYFTKRDYSTDAWQKLQKEVHEYGIRNAYLMAVAPTSSTSVLAGTTAGIDPIMKRFFLEEKKGSILPRVAPDLNRSTYWLYKSAHVIDQTWSIRANGLRQRHIDQAQSFNLYITNDYTMRQVLDLYLLAWECGVKTMYYVRSKSLEVEECDVCSA